MDYETECMPEDMINMLKLPYVPNTCCWVHRRGQAQGLLAMYVYSVQVFRLQPHLLRSSDKNSGVIRLYDGRGNGEPLETIDKLHRSPVHVMTVRMLNIIPDHRLKQR